MKECINKTIERIEGLNQDSQNVTIYFEDGSYINQEHMQDCCEYVRVEQVDGNVEKHIGAKFLELVEKTNVAEDVSDSGTYTFYTLKTNKGYLDWRWLGESNGYYSESVDMCYSGDKGRRDFY